MTTQDRRIKLVNCCVWGIGAGGGVARNESFLYRFLDRNLFEPLFVVTSDHNPEEAPDDPSIPFVFSGKDNRFDVLLKHFSEADVVMYSGKYFSLICEAARLSKVPVLVEVMRNIDAGQHYRQVDLTICVSETVRKMQPFPDKTRVIRNGIDIDSFSFENNRKKDGKIILLQVSNRVKASFNLDELAADILPIDPRIELWLAGADQIAPSSDRVKFLGLRNDIAELYRSADILTLFSRTEAFGLVVIEAMACGCLPIVSNAGGPAEIVTDGENGFVAPYADEKETLSVIRKALALHGTEKWDQMRFAARKLVEEEYRAQSCVNNYESILLDLVNRKGKRNSRGPTRISAPSEVELGEAAYYLEAGQWEKVEECVNNMAQSPEPLKAPVAVEIATRLAKHSIVNHKTEIAEIIYSKLHASGHRDVEWLKLWSKIIPEDRKHEFPFDKLLALEPSNPEIIMEKVESQLKSKDIGAALITLEQGILLCPHSKELSEIYELLKTKAP